MARAKQQPQASNFGTIKHKATEKLTKEQRIAREREELKKRREAKDPRRSAGNHSRSQSPAKGKSSAAQKEKRPAVDTGYKGTMRPSAPTPTQSSYKGTMRPSGSSKPSAKDTSKKEKIRMAGYASYSENEDDDMWEDSFDDLSDMEAGAFDLEEEEQFSLRHAKKEDLDALNEEAAHKRAKLERKRAIISGRR